MKTETMIGCAKAAARLEGVFSESTNRPCSICLIVRENGMEITAQSDHHNVGRVISWDKIEQSTFREIEVQIELVERDLYHAANVLKS